MKKLASLFLLVSGFSLIGIISPISASAAYVKGYYRSNSTYVNSYYRSAPSYNYTKSYTYSAPKYNYSNSYTSGLKWQNTYYKPSTGKYVSGHYKTYSDGYSWNNRRNLYGF